MVASRVTDMYILCPTIGAQLRLCIATSRLLSEDYRLILPRRTRGVRDAAATVNLRCLEGKSDSRPRPRDR